MTTQILFKKLDPTAQIPHRASEHAACFDLYACTTHVEDQKVVVGTGLATAFPEGHVLLIFSRSGHGFKHGIHLLNGVGVIDADYRGEIKLAFASKHIPVMHAAALLASGQRVAQALLLPLPAVEWLEMPEHSELPSSLRGEGGFGSTGS